MSLAPCASRTAALHGTSFSRIDLGTSCTSTFRDAAFAAEALVLPGQPTFLTQLGRRLEVNSIGWRKLFAISIGKYMRRKRNARFFSNVFTRN